MTLHSSRVLTSDLPPCSSDNQWYVVHCQPLRERYAAQNLSQRLGLTIYLPEVRRHFRGKVEASPLFPRYLFVKADLQRTSVSQINAIEGVSRMVAFGDLPFPIPEEVMGALYEQVEALNADGGLAGHSLRQGEPVRIVDGPFTGLEAIFLGPLEPNARVHVLIEFLGQLRKIELGADAIASLDQQVPRRLRRGTRGKGRKIRVKL